MQKERVLEEFGEELLMEERTLNFALLVNN